MAVIGKGTRRIGDTHARLQVIFLKVFLLFFALFFFIPPLLLCSATLTILLEMSDVKHAIKGISIDSVVHFCIDTNLACLLVDDQDQKMDHYFCPPLKCLSLVVWQWSVAGWSRDIWSVNIQEHGLMLICCRHDSWVNKMVINRLNPPCWLWSASKIKNAFYIFKVYSKNQDLKAWPSSSIGAKAGEFWMLNQHKEKVEKMELATQSLFSQKSFQWLCARRLV